MPLDSSDFKLLKSIRSAVQDGDAATQDLLRQLLERQNATLQAEKETAKAFNRVADALQGVSEEIRGLRNDLAPPLEKHKKMSRPATPRARQ